MVREATHAGSWYSDDAKQLRSQLDGWLSDASIDPVVAPPFRALIGPHAGYSYSGPTAAWAYQYLAACKTEVKRVFLLGPSHHVYLDTCALTEQAEYATPLGALPVDTDLVKKLAKDQPAFKTMTRRVDENEHSLELHLPYIRHALADRPDITLVPIMVGAVSTATEALFGQTLVPYLEDPGNFFVVSSDFCHWGSRFDFTSYDKSHGEIWQSIEAMDKDGMDAVASLEPPVFTKYLQATHNTICGRHPISVLMQTVAASSQSYAFSWVRYAQSSKCKSSRDSSVSYASGILSSVPDKKDKR